MHLSYNEHPPPHYANMTMTDGQSLFGVLVHEAENSPSVCGSSGWGWGGLYFGKHSFLKIIN